jgi:uncharacterized integral membrane protein
MQNLWLKIKVWTKVSVFTLVVLYALIFMFSNSNQSVNIWLWFGKRIETSALGVLFGTLILGCVLTLLGGVAFRTIRQIKEMKRQSAHAQMQQDVADMKAKAAGLNVKPVESGGSSVTGV